VLSVDCLVFSVQCLVFNVECLLFGVEGGEFVILGVGDVPRRSARFPSSSVEC